MYIDPDGKVRTVGVVRSTWHPDLDLAAAAGLYHCLATPGRRWENRHPDHIYVVKAAMIAS